MPKSTHPRERRAHLRPRGPAQETGPQRPGRGYRQCDELEINFIGTADKKRRGRQYMPVPRLAPHHGCTGRGPGGHGETEDAQCIVHEDRVLRGPGHGHGTRDQCRRPRGPASRQQQGQDGYREHDECRTAEGETAVSSAGGALDQPVQPRNPACIGDLKFT